MFADFQMTVVMALFMVALPSLIHAKTRIIAFVLMVAWILSEMTVRISLGVDPFPFWGDFVPADNAVLADYAPWRVFLIINAIAAVLIVRPISNRIGAIIASLFMIQMILDMGFGAAGNPQMTESYIIWQTRVMWLQIIILGLYNAGHFGGYMWRRSRPLPVKVGAKGVAR